MKDFMILRFQDAVLFRNKDTKDKRYLGPKDKGEPKKDFPQFKEYLTYHQVSNVLHVLFNERPVPFFGACIYEKQDWLVEKAKESFIKLHVSTWATKKGDIREITEMYRTRKPAWNANAKIENLTWDFIEQYLSHHYDEFIEMLKAATKHPNPRSVDVQGVPELFRQSVYHAEKERLLEHFSDRKVGKIGVYHWLRRKFEEETKEPIEMAKDSIAKGLKLVLGSGIDKVVRLNGSILVPIDEEDKKILQDSSGVATILDGGLVWIERIVPGNRLSIEGYEKVGDISTQLITL